MHRSLTHAFRFALPAAVACALAGAACPAAPVHHSKPGIPVSVSFEPGTEFHGGDTHALTVIAIVLADSDDFSLDVDLPGEVALYSGDLHRRGAVRANTQLRLGLVLRARPQGSAVITATARLVAGDAGAFEVTASHRVGAPSSAAAAAEGGALHDRNGEPVREFQLP